MDGLRDRKKLATRQAVSEHAMTLFAARGFEGVTVADVAAAAGVAVQTVFNYFPAKEDLVLAGRADIEAALLRQVAERPPGDPVIAAVRAHTLDLMRHLRAMPAERRRRFRKVLHESPSIGQRLRVLSLSTERELADAIAAEQSDGDEAACRLVASTLMALANLPYSLDVGTGKAAARDLERSIEGVFDLFENGLGSYARKRGPQRAARQAAS